MTSLVRCGNFNRNSNTYTTCRKSKLLSGVLAPAITCDTTDKHTKALLLRLFTLQLSRWILGKTFYFYLGGLSKQAHRQQKSSSHMNKSPAAMVIGHDYLSNLVEYSDTTAMIGHENNKSKESIFIKNMHYMKLKCSTFMHI